MPNQRTTRRPLLRPVAVGRPLRERYAGRAIALTGYGMDSDIAASREAGFVEHLTKPVDLASPTDAIERVSYRILA